jgi:hypothetical protein
LPVADEQLTHERRIVRARPGKLQEDLGGARGDARVAFLCSGNERGARGQAHDGQLLSGGIAHARIGVGQVVDQVLRALWLGLGRSF